MIYVYAIASLDASLRQDIPGLGGHALQLVDSGQMRALISENAPEISQDATSLGLLWLEHQKIVNNLSANSVLPAKLGSRLSSVEAVADLLSLHQETLLEQLNNLQGKVQINVSAFWKLNEEIAKIALFTQLLQNLPVSSSVIWFQSS